MSLCHAGWLPEPREKEKKLFSSFSKAQVVCTRCKRKRRRKIKKSCCRWNKKLILYLHQRSSFARAAVTNKLKTLIHAERERESFLYIIPPADFHSYEQRVFRSFAIGHIVLYSPGWICVPSKMHTLLAERQVCMMVPRIIIRARMIIFTFTHRRCQVRTLNIN